MQFAIRNPKFAMNEVPSATSPRWVSWLPWVVLASFTALWLTRWPFFPLFLDPYYHLLIARQMLDAGGPITYEWWEYAPVGRVHLYPPALHLILAGVLGAGVSPITAIRLVTWLLAPGVLLAIYLAMRRLVPRSVACACLLMALVPFSWVLQCSQALASGLASIVLVWLMVSLHHHRWLAAACLLGLLCYTHLGLPWVALASIGWWLVLKAVPRHRALLWSVGGGLLIGLPWLWHVLSHRHLLQVVSRYENKTIDIMIVLYAFAAIGLWRCARATGALRLLLGLWLGFALMAPRFLFRWLSGEGLLPVILLAGYGLAGVAKRLTRSRRQPAARWAVIVGLSAVATLSPSVVFSEGTVQIAWPDSTPFHLVNWPATRHKGLDIHLYTQYTARLAKTLIAVSQPGEIFWSNASYVGGLIATLAHRPMSSAMLYEVPPARPFDPIDAAQWIVWLKIGSFPGVPPLEEVIHRYRLTQVYEDEIARVFRHPGAVRTATAPRAALSWVIVFVLSCGFLGLVVWDLRGLPQGPAEE